MDYLQKLIKIIEFVVKHAGFNERETQQFWTLLQRKFTENIFAKLNNALNPEDMLNLRNTSFQGMKDLQDLSNVYEKYYHEDDIKEIVVSCLEEIVDEIKTYVENTNSPAFIRKYNEFVKTLFR